MHSPITSVDVRRGLLHALRLDLVGPDSTLGSLDEVLDQAPSRFYLTGFLVPSDAGTVQRVDVDSTDEVDAAGESSSADDATTPEPPAARQKYLPSSIGLSLLLPKEAESLHVRVRWGDYRHRLEGEAPRQDERWDRTDREGELTLRIPASRGKAPAESDVPGSAGLRVALAVRDVVSDGQDCQLPVGTRSVSVFLVNRRPPSPDEVRDEAFAFQTQLEVTSDEPFVPRPNVRSLGSDDWDDRVADLQYRDVCEYAVGHNVATELDLCDGRCYKVRTCWTPQAEVERVAPVEMKSVELSMDRLGALADGHDARERLSPLATEYRAWIESQQLKAPGSPPRRKETVEELLNRARVAASRIEQGITLLDDPECLEAFRTANRAMATAARRRLGVMRNKSPESVEPRWRPFQLAFLLMNLKGLAQPTDPDREVVDLLFFPTGGGKTEAYLGLAAFTLVLRRLRNPGIRSAGLSVLMRYTLRLLTLDQLGRASTLICALELERQQDVGKLGEWPFEIGLWVGKAATPNVMGRKGDNNKDSARAKTIAFQNDDRKPSPIPLEDCPWCGTKFKSSSFRLVPNPGEPTDLRINCVNRDCAFSRGNPLPILAVDEPIYRRLPCFLIATVDKFTAMPWTGEVGAFFGRVQRHDKQGFYGPCHPTAGNALPVDRLPPPDLIVQDELHLISGPLGTIAGLYETALDELCTREVDGKRVRPKIVASTATVRRAEKQIRALFNHHLVDIFPPPGPDRRDSFFAETHTTARSNARLYLGVAAQGRSPKVVMLRVYVALLAAAQGWYERHDRKSGLPNPADPYMTVLGYFNSLRELGGARRLIEDEVRNRVSRYATRMRVGEEAGPFVDRDIDYDPVELTSRESTAKVSEAKRRLSLTFDEKGKVDVAIATNMISVGLDITRLGLMVVFGQPKTSAEYIQASSRVGRDEDRPGLVVSILNVHKPRDRSHFERFCAYHESFYRSVEATSVTPFSPRALDRALAGTLVALARQGHTPMTAPRGAAEILRERTTLESAVEVLAERAFGHDRSLTEQESQRLRQRVRERSLDLLDEWSKAADEAQLVGGALQYQAEVGGSAPRLLHEFLSPDVRNLPPQNRKMKFRANRSMRDVEPSVNLWLTTLDGVSIEEDEA
ncbi:DISARM system helicase DrmA [Paludisphaera soli]|uniref:DISARM system helicase DrmA n=1 Tax=Paludisphaera soli TaxID=2712865 RepID=UPI0013E9A980|nr:DISARM system helicase DrmA [Paludisphaera soli]